VSKAVQKTAVTILYVTFRANTAKHTAKPGKVQCWFRTSYFLHYKVTSPLSFPLKMEKKKKRKKN